MQSARKVACLLLDPCAQPRCSRVVQRLGGGRGCHKFVPVLGGDGTKMAPPEDLFDQPSGDMI